MLVVESLLEDSDYNALDKEGQRVVLLAAILHDIAKPFCTKTQDGKIVSPNHAVKGAVEARKLIYKYGFMEELLGKFSFVNREQVCSLIRYHGLPLLFLEKPDIKMAIFKASLDIPLEYLYILTKADLNGRYSKSNQSNLKTVELFKDYCIENKCFTDPKNFQNASSKLMYFKHGPEYLNYAPYEMDKSHVYVMSGIPASGKDTYIKNNLSGYRVISLDEIREEMGIDPAKSQGIVVQEAKLRSKKLLAAKESFVWNATNNTEKLRTSLIDLLIGYNAFVEIVYTETDVAELLRRNTLRKKPVPEKVINKLIDNLEVPKLWESHMVKYYTK